MSPEVVLSQNALSALALSSSLVTPFLALDPAVACARLDEFRAAMPEADVHYAVKANAHPELLRELVLRGCAFDVASVPEVRACLEAGALPERLAYGNPIRKPSDIAEAFRLGVRVFVTDSRPECVRLAEAAPNCDFLVRVEVPNGKAGWPLSGKFGCSPTEAAELMVLGASLGMRALGVSFHVGSQQPDPEAFAIAVEVAGGVLRAAAERGVTALTVNLGGGWPVNMREGVPAILEFGLVVREAARRFLPEGVRLMAEPGRFIVAEAGILACEVISRVERAGREWLYLDVGRFGGLAETEGESIRYALEIPGREGAPIPFVLAGPTCDGADVLYLHASPSLPCDIAAGDRLLFRAAGAYTTVYASREFNGMPAPETFIVHKDATS